MKKSKLVSFTNAGTYECVSSTPLREYEILSDGSLIELPAKLLAVKVNSKWGWINNKNEFVILPQYDYPVDECFNDILIVEKNGFYGGIYKNGTEAFKFKYVALHRMYNNTYYARTQGGDSCLIKPGDIVLSDTNYFDFVFNNYQRRIKCSKVNFFHQKIDVFLDLETGKEISEFEFLNRQDDNRCVQNDNNSIKVARIKDFEEQFELLTHSLYLKFNDKFCSCKNPIIIFDDVENYKCIVRDKGETSIDLLYNDSNAKIIASYETIEEMVADGWVLD